MDHFLPLQKELEEIYAALTAQTPLTVDCIRQEPFLQIIDRSDYLITIHDVEYYRPICINEKLREFYGFNNRILQGMDHFYYLKTMHLSTYYTLIESMAFFRNDPPGYLNLKYKLLASTGQWKKTIGTSKAIIRNGRGSSKVAMTVMKPMEIEVSISPYEQYLSLTSRELEIVGLLYDGLSKKEIAGKLFISPDTVITHVKNIYRKLGVNKISELSRLVEQFRVGG
ncbi:helix-turn-helix transcriptional regulator [Parapedobacter sp. 10938]|uniref:helix-turn-helix transcriptional regulator n=1 Tax=Parapedobacter flavus TaxID=3110225 RepID=UPI002DB9F91A|nr:helix-turn-helix transcriptional regulator [Parapedobacter sp. 10938]MEC3880082.1 helix-turn-helix transcriptional regulator [Parapedobacter sp. 10938]